MELRNDTDALVDQVQVVGFRIIGFDDIESLVKRGIVTVKEGMENGQITENGETFHRIYIKGTDDAPFTELSYSVGIDGRIGGNIRMNVPNDGYGNLNCLTMFQYANRIAQIPPLSHGYLWYRNRFF